MKRSLALIMALVLCMGLFAGCNSNNTPVETNPPAVNDPGTTEAPEVTEAPEAKDPVTITYWYTNNIGEQEYTKRVEEELNAILKETPGYEHISIDLVPCKDYKTDLTLALSTGQQVDLIATFNYGATDKILLGEYLELSELVANNPEITADLPDWFLNYGKVDGGLYFIPNYQQLANTMFWFTTAEYAEKAGYTKEQITEIIQSGDLEKHLQLEKDLCDAARSLGKNAYIFSTQVSNARRFTSYSNTQLSFGSNSYLYLNSADNSIAWSDGDEWASAWFKAVTELRAEGYVYKEEATEHTEFFGGTWPDRFNSDVGKAVISAGMTGYTGTSEMVEAQMKEQFGQDMIAVLCNVNAEIILPAENAAGGIAIASNSKYPEDAAKVMALLFNSKYEKFYNTLCWGIEGIHYNKIDDGHIETLEFAGSQGGADTTYCYWKWVGGNTFNAWLNQSLTDEQEAYILSNINEGSDTNTTIAGFIFDPSSVETEIEQCKAVAGEYSSTLRNGIKDAAWEDYYNEYKSKMQTAGLDKIIEEYSRQFNEWLNNK